MNSVICQNCGRQLAVGEPFFRVDKRKVCRPCRDIDQRIIIQPRLKFYGVNIADCEAQRATLAASLGRKPNRLEIIDALYRKLLKDATPAKQIQIYIGLAGEYHQAGLDPHPIKQQLERLTLSQFVAGHVRIVADAIACDNCRSLDGKILTVAEAQATMPIPCRECRFVFAETSPFGWCRCMYVAHYEPRRNPA